MKKALLLLGMFSLSLWGFAQVSKQQAIIIVMDSIIGNDSTIVNVYMKPALQTDNYFVINGYDSIPSPFTNYWLFFIDDKPEYLWGHSCRYIILGGSDSIQITRKSLPPSALSTEFEEVSIVYKLTYSDIMGYPETNACDVIPAYDVNDGKYAVLFTGGGTGGTINNFWTSLSHMYCGLIEHGFKKDNIYVLSADGRNDTLMNPGGLDLDGDGIDDILPDTCTAANVGIVLTEIEEKIGEGDLLYVFPSTHGQAYDSINDGAQFIMFGDDRLPDTVFANFFQNINCAQIIFNINSCFSGGFTDELIAVNPSVRKVILTAIDSQNSYSSSYGSLSMARYPYLTCTAFRGWHPKKNVWSCHEALIGEKPDFVTIFGREEINFDLIENGGNGNGKQEVGELMEYVALYDTHFGPQGSKIYNCGFIEDLLCLHGITGRVTTNQSIDGCFHIEDTLSICADTFMMEDFSKFNLFDADLIIEDTAFLIMGDTAAIIARSGDCRVIVKGNLTLGNGVTFEARDGATLDIIFENDVDLAISNATFINCTLELPKRNLSFNDCRFIGTPLEMNNASDQSSEIDKMASVINCEFSPNGNNINNALYIKNFAQYKVNGCKIEANDGGIFKNGIAIYNCGSNLGLEQVHGNDVSGCLQSGIQMYASSGNITMNTVYGNGYGIKLLNNCNISSLSGNCGATLESDTQFIHDNTNNEIYMTGSSIPQRFRYNAIHHNGNIPYVNHDAYIAFGNENRGSIDVKYNYWGNGFTPSTHLHTNLIGGEYVYNPEWILGNCYNDWADAAMLLNGADSLNVAGAYLDAQIMYKQVVENYPETVSAETALKSLLALEAQFGGEYLSLKEYYLTNNTIAADETLSHLASSLANKCDEKMENFTDAISWYEEILTSPETSFNDSIFAAIDLGDLYLRIETIGEKAVGKLTQYKPESEVLYKRQTDYALSLMPKERCYSIELPSVSNMEISVGENDTISLNWYYPESFEPQNEQSLSWSIGNVYDQWGGPCAECNWSVAHRYEERDLEGLIGWKIKSVSIIPWREVDVYEIRIWKGTLENYSLVYSKVVEYPILQGWTSVAIDEDIYIENGQEYFMGYKAYAPGGYFLPMDDKPVVHNKGDLIEYNPNQGWMTTGYYYGNFMISTVLENEEGRVAKAVSDALTGYRVYRDGNMIAEIPYTFQTYFTDTEFTKGFDVEYCVTAVYGEEESEPVCATATITGVNEADNDGIVVSPNPTIGLVRIEGACVAEVKVHNILGQMVKTIQSANTFSVAGLPTGLYLLRITDGEGATVTRRIVVK
ncbi:MAG: T9SS type A sorting domain-containing protein [Bacteroidales bacterium]|nr:T9SS type A sorting domain-containing protein [Bacteroidales bacterium]